MINTRRTSSVCYHNRCYFDKWGYIEVRRAFFRGFKYAYRQRALRVPRMQKTRFCTPSALKGTCVEAIPRGYWGARALLTSCPGCVQASRLAGSSELCAHPIAPPDTAGVAFGWTLCSSFPHMP